MEEVKRADMLFPGQVEPGKLATPADPEALNARKASPGEAGIGPDGRPRLSHVTDRALLRIGPLELGVSEHRRTEARRSHGHAFGLCVFLVLSGAFLEVRERAGHGRKTRTRRPLDLFAMRGATSHRIVMPPAASRPARVLYLSFKPRRRAAMERVHEN